MSWGPIKPGKGRSPTPLKRMDWSGLADISYVLVSKVIVPDDTPDPDPVLVANIAESECDHE
jgi:hypothetical protein